MQLHNLTGGPADWQIGDRGTKICTNSLTDDRWINLQKDSQVNSWNGRLSD
jgi:hypothetical protein